MPRKAKEILKARGYTDEELNGLTLLTDARFVKALEDEDAERERIVAEHARMQSQLADTTRWYNEEAVPTLNNNLAEVVKTRAEIARLNAQLKAEQDLGMRRVANQPSEPAQPAQPAQPAPAGAPDFTQYDERYINRDTFTQAFSQTGEAIAMATDIMEDHRDLFGKRLPEGIGGLRAKYQEATKTGFRGNLRDFWEKEFNVAQKRTEIATKNQEEHDRKIAEEAVRKYQSEHLNPMTRTPVASNSPFLRKQKIEGGTTDGKQPWERGAPEARRAERVVKFGTKVLTGTGV